MYMNDRLEILTYKNDNFSLRIKDKCIKLSNEDIVSFCINDNENIIFEKRCFIYKDVAYLNITLDDAEKIPIGDFTYSIHIMLNNKKVSDTIIYKNKFTMKG